jgi:hypothetical protein
MIRKGRAESGPSRQKRQNATPKLRNFEKAYPFLESRRFVRNGVVACTARRCMEFIGVRPGRKAQT